MGLLAGAVMGLGKGMMINAEADRQAEAKDLDFMREQKLAELRGQIEGGLQKERMTFEGGENLVDLEQPKRHVLVRLHAGHGSARGRQFQVRIS